MTNLEKIKNMSIDAFAEWLDNNSMIDGTPWNKWFSKAYCDKCESIKCTYTYSEEKLGIIPFYNSTIECSYCELHGKCRFFEELEEIPDNCETIKMWLIEEAE